MSFDGYFNFGGVEIINAKRTTDYVRNLAGGLPLVRRTTIYDTLNAVLGDPEYRTPFLDGASWIETDPPSNLEQANPTHNFYGFYPLEILGIGDSTMGASVVEALGDGGFVNTPRNSSRPIKFHGILLGGDMLSAEHGLTWLRNAIKGASCGMHGDTCGYSDLRFFLAPPNVCDPQFNADFTANTADQIMGPLSVATSPITFYPNTDGSPIRLEWVFDNQDGAIIRWGTEDIDGPDVFQSLGPIQVRRTNFVPNPSFTNDVSNWVTGSATLTQVNDSIDEPYAHADQSASPVTYRSNWLPDPSFEHGDPNSLGWRGSDDITQVADGTAPNGTHVAVVGTDAGGNWMEATMLGPYDSGTTGTFSFYNRHNTDVTVQVKDNTGTVIFTHVFSGLTEAWARLSVSGVPMKVNYTIRVSTDGTKELRTDAYLLEAVGTLGTFFTGDSGAGYTFVGGNPANASRFTSGTNTAFHIETPNTVAPVGPMMATFLLRATESAPSILVELVDPVGTVLGANVYTPGTSWTRYALGVPFGGQAKLRFTSSTGAFDIDEVMYEAGAIVNPYFDGSFTAPDDYTIAWLGAPNASPSRMDWIGTTLLEASGPERFFLTLDAGHLQSVIARSWWPARISVDEQMEPYDRTYHNVYTVQGVQRIKDYTFDTGAGIEVDFILQAEVPFPFSTQSESIPFIPDNAINYSDPRDVTTNLFTNPSAETVGASGLAFTNLVTNPSCETATTGWTAIPGTTGVAALTAPVATTTYGTHVLHCAWTTASTAAGGGASFDVPVTAGLAYSFFMGLIRSSINNLLQLQVEWRTSSATISTVTAASIAATAAANYSSSLVNQVAPATATVARVKVISIAGTGFANWSIGSYLELDGLMATQTTILPAYFDGSYTPNIDFASTAWTGTAHASTSTANTFALEATWVPGAGTGGTVISYAALSQHFVGGRSACQQWTVASTDPSTGGMIVGGNHNGPTVTPGVPYTGSIYVWPSKNQKMQAQIQFYDATNTLIGSAVLGTAVSVVGGVWTRLSVETVSPTNAVKVRVAATATTVAAGATNWAVGDKLYTDAAMVATGFNLSDYFDGSFVDTVNMNYAWVGAANASASTATVIPSTVASIIDPDLPALPTPPLAPSIPDIALSDLEDWTRYFLTIPKGNVAEWASTIPTLTLLTKTDEARQVRVRFYPNPFEWDQGDVDPTAYCGEFLLSYLPANSQVVVDGVSRAASANVAGTGEQPASQLLYGTDGGPMVWPELSCGIGYLMTVDVPPTADIDNLDLELVVNRRE